MVFVLDRLSLFRHSTFGFRHSFIVVCPLEVKIKRKSKARSKRSTWHIYASWYVNLLL